MKCPKCGYHSFDYLDSCKKCDNDLTSFKSKFNLRSLIFPHLTTLAAVSPEPESAASKVLSQTAPPAATATTDFGFDFMDEGSTPAGPEPAKFDLPELDGASSRITADTLPAEDDTFTWDEEPLPTAVAPAAASGPGEDFDWAEEPPQDSAAAEEGTFEETESDDTFGLDLSWDADLPALDEDQLEEEEPLEPMGTDDLPDWDFDEEPPLEAKKTQKPKGQEEPSDPFELRGPGAEVPAPVTADTTATVPAELPFELETEVETEPMTSAATTAAAVSAVPASVVTAEAPWADDEEDLLTALEAILPVDAAAPPASPSPIVRGLALVIDLLVLAVAILLFLVAGEMALAPEGSQHLLPSPEVLLNLAIPYFLVLFSVCFGYFTLFHFLTGQTPGKMLLHLRVETEAGAPLAFSQAFLRSTGGLFSLLLLGLGFLVILFDHRRRGWNDRWAGTLVVTTSTTAETPDKTEIDLQ